MISQMVHLFTSAALVGAVTVTQESLTTPTSTTTNLRSSSTSSLVSTAPVTAGAWATETHSSCSSLDSEPPVIGFNLGACVGSIAGSSVSHMYTSCEWGDAEKSLLTVTYNYYTNSAFCEGDYTVISSPKSGLVDGCKGGKLYQCGATVGFANYGASQHVGSWNAGSCGTTAEEMEWEIASYESCTDSAGCTVFSSSYSSRGVCHDRDDTCFHVETKIDYKGVEYTYDELLIGKEPECTVPHSPSSKGVVITTSCDRTVRVTDTHLMATTKGFQLAYSLKAGDVLFGDYNDKKCTVKSVEKEKSSQQYFGLNCVHSVVLASGLRASTFGDFHTLPSWYMTYVGGLLGSKTASFLGEYVAEWYFQKNHAT